MYYDPYPPQASFYVTPQGLICGKLLGGGGWKVTVSFNIDGLGNVAPDLRATVNPQGPYGIYAGPLRAPVWLYGPGAEVYLPGGFDWEIILHHPVHGEAHALLEARILPPPPPLFALPLPETPPPQYQPGDGLHSAPARFEQPGLQARARNCVAHVLLMQRIRRAMFPTALPVAAPPPIPLPPS